jgi:hypothetical protein
MRPRFQSGREGRIASGTGTLLEGIEGEVTLPAIGVRLSLSEIYEGVVFPIRPRLVRESEP